MGLKPKIVVGFGSLLAIIVGMGLVGYRSAVVGQKTSQDVYLYSHMKDMNSALQEDLLTQRVGERDILMGKGNDTLRLYEHGEEDFRNAMEDCKPLLPSDDAREQFARIELARENYVRRNDQWWPCTERGTQTEQTRCSGSLRGRRRATRWHLP